MLTLPNLLHVLHVSTNLTMTLMLVPERTSVLCESADQRCDKEPCLLDPFHRHKQVIDLGSISSVCRVITGTAPHIP